MTAPFTDHFSQAKDAPLLYARDYAAVGAESGLPVVCLHGLTRNARDFELLAPWLAEQGRRTIVPDIRGRGQSGKSADPMDYKPATYARDVRGQLEELGIKRAVFIGTSMGGLITMTLALQKNRLVAAAALNDVGPEIAPQGLERITAYLGDPGPVSCAEDAYAYVRRVTKGAMPGLTDEGTDIIARRLFRMDGAKPVLDYDPKIAVPLANAKAVPKWFGWAVYRWLARRPLLLIRGELSDILARDTAMRMIRLGKKVDYAEIPRIGHAPLLDEKEARDALAAWLRTVP